MNATRGNKHVGFRKTVRRRNYKNLKPQNSRHPNAHFSPANFVENMPHEPLKPEHSVANFSLLANVLPANHYNTQRYKAMTRRNRGLIYPYSQQNAENVGKIMLTSENEPQAMAAMNRLYPNHLSADENAILEGILNSVRRGVNKEIVHILNTQFVQTRTPIPHNFYLVTVSQTTKRYLKMAIAEVLAFPDWSFEVKTNIIDQLRKRIMMEKMRKGWFQYRDALF